MVSVKLGVTGAAGEPKSSGDREETEASTGSSRSPGTAWHTTPGRWRQAPGSANRSHRPTLLVGLEVHCFHHHEVMPVDLSVGDPLLLLLLLFLLPLTLLELGPFYTVTHLKGAEQRSAELNQGQLPRRLSPPGPSPETVSPSKQEATLPTRGTSWSRLCNLHLVSARPRIWTELKI